MPLLVMFSANSVYFGARSTDPVLGQEFCYFPPICETYLQLFCWLYLQILGQDQYNVTIKIFTEILSLHYL